MNRTDIAQPSTSYAAPYLFSWLLSFFGRESAIYLYTLTGLICVALTMSLIVLFSASRMLGISLVAALCLTTTHLLYGLGGWDHVFQGFFVTVATCLSMTKVRPARAVVIALLLVVETLFRPDGGLLALGILLSLHFSTRQWRVVASGLVSYMVLMGLAVAIKYHQFGHLTPTPVRLKVGGAPSLSYILHYIFANGLLSYSALTLFAGLVLLAIACRMMSRYPQTIPIMIACVITVGIALYNSDYFAGARMVWSSTCVLAATFAVLTPRFLPSGVRCDWTVFAKSLQRIPSSARLIVVAYATVVTAGITATAVRRKMQEATLSPQAVGTSPVAQQYVIARWINANLHPNDGAIGLFYLGVSYDLTSFEIADFLGKGDEAIASLKKKQGPPGHNKWDLDRTLSKWKPQAVIPPGPVDPHLAETTENSHRHAPDLLLNKRLVTGFEYCYVPAADLGVVDKWGFFLRRDIAERLSGELHCS